MKEFRNYHILEIKYLQPRVRIYSDCFGESIDIDFDYDLNSAAEVAQKYLTDKGFELIGKGGTEDGSVLISTTFEPLK